MPQAKATMQTTTSVRIGRRVFRVPELMISPKEIIDESFNIYRVSISNIGVQNEKYLNIYKQLFECLKSEDNLLDVELKNGKQTVIMIDALITHYVYPFGIVYEFESEVVKEITKK